VQDLTSYKWKEKKNTYNRNILWLSWAVEAQIIITTLNGLRLTRHVTLRVNCWFCPYQACACFALESQRIQQWHQRLSKWRIICETDNNFKSVLLPLPRPDLWPLFPYRSSYFDILKLISQVWRSSGPASYK